jgi:hypothetical protein
VNVSVNPKNTFIYAASKGREYYDKSGTRKTYPISKDKQQKLNELNEKLKELVDIPKFRKFSLIGSGLQIKFGQTTIAHQDIVESISRSESDAFLEEINKIINEIDHNRSYFRTEDTGKDLEIILTINENNLSKNRDFDKGDGVMFLEKDIGLSMRKGPNLICGDTLSDIPMLKTSMDLSDDTYTIFVTDNDNIKQKVQYICPNAFFVSKPDTLVMILNNLAMGV